MNDQGPDRASAPHRPEASGPEIAPTPPTLAPPEIAPFTQPAPEIPPLDAPDARFVLTPRASDELARHNALRATPRLTGIFLAIAVPTSTFTLLWLGLSWKPILVSQIVVAVYVTVVVYFSLQRQFRNLLRSDVTNGSCAVTLGADALDLAERSTRTRIGYDRIRSVKATRHIVTLSFDNRHVVLPRGLFPDPLLARLRELLDPHAPDRPAPLPPLPVLPHPHSHTVIAADTAKRLTVARRLEPRVSGRFAATFLVVVVGALGGMEYGVPGAVSALIVGTLFVLAVRFWSGRPTANALRQLQGMLPVASGLAAQFGTDAIVLAGTTFVFRAPYSIVTKVVIRADCAVVSYGGTPLILPAALFPRELRPGLREHGVTVIESQSPDPRTPR